jgi:hypothetical protein
MSTDHEARFEDKATASRLVFDIDDIGDRMMGVRFSPADTERINDAILRLSRVVVKCGLYATSHGGPSDAI